LRQQLRRRHQRTAMLAGLALSHGGIFTLLMTPIVGKFVSIVQPKYLIMVGASIVVFAMWHLAGLNGDITYSYAAWSRSFLGIGRPFLFLQSPPLPMTACRPTRPTRPRR
jgi:DHA2 family multidrug resistance protein